MASSVSSLFGASNTAPGSSPSPSASPAAPDEQMFLKLLVSQIQNQDPLNPTDSTQFVSQLAQFSELEQLIAIRGDIETNQGTGTSAATGNTPPASGATGNSGLPGTDPTTSGTGTTGTGSTGTGNTNSNTNQN